MIEFRQYSIVNIQFSILTTLSVEAAYVKNNRTYIKNIRLRSRAPLAGGISHLIFFILSAHQGTGRRKSRVYQHTR
jgi:hypothetical protein